MASKLIYAVDDDKTVLVLLNVYIEKWGYRSRLFNDAESCLKNMEDPPDLVMLDIMLPNKNGVETLKEIKGKYPDVQVIMLSAQGNIDVVVESMKLGAVDYFTKPIDFPKLEIAVRNALQMGELTQEVKQLRQTVERSVHFENIISNHGSMNAVFNLVRKVMDNDICVLIQGESGTGKELIAQAIHFNGKRKNGPFVIVNCASIPRDLLESEIFGHERGAFTGAFTKRIGRFEQANGGTVFLDEVSEIDLSLQVKLLRVLQTKEFERVGGNETIKSDVRIISATNKDLTRAVIEKEFREDLYYRLAAFPILLPPLRDRKTDIALLSEHFLRKFAQKQSKPLKAFTPNVLRMLTNYPWPGNVRELENSIERAVILAEDEAIVESDLPLAIHTHFSDGNTNPKNESIFEGINTIIPYDQIKEATLRNALKITKGNILEAAKKLEISRVTIYRLMKKYHIEE
jgi:DNA-binding NtrC family response regulator